MCGIKRSNNHRGKYFMSIKSELPNMDVRGLLNSYYRLWANYLSLREELQNSSIDLSAEIIAKLDWTNREKNLVRMELGNRLEKILSHQDVIELYYKDEIARLNTIIDSNTDENKDAEFYDFDDIGSNPNRKFIYDALYHASMNMKDGEYNSIIGKHGIAFVAHFNDEKIPALIQDQITIIIDFLEGKNKDENTISQVESNSNK